MNTFCERDPPSSGIKLHFTPLFGLSYSFLCVNIFDWPFYKLCLNLIKFVSICNQKAEVARGLELARHTWKPDNAQRITCNEPHVLYYLLYRQKNKKISIRGGGKDDECSRFNTLSALSCKIRSQKVASSILSTTIRNVRRTWEI